MNPITFIKKNPFPHDGYYAGKFFQPMCPSHVVLHLLALMNTSTDVFHSDTVLEQDVSE